MPKRVNARFHRQHIAISNDFMLCRRAIADDIREAVDRFSHHFNNNHSDGVDLRPSISIFKQVSWDRLDFISILIVPVCRETITPTDTSDSADSLNGIEDFSQCWSGFVNELFGNCVKYLVCSPISSDYHYSLRQLGALYLLYLLYECTQRSIPIRIPHSFSQDLSRTFDQLASTFNDAAIIINRLLESQAFHLCHYDECLMELVHYMRSFDGLGGRFPSIDDFSTVHSSAVLDRMEATESRLIVDWLDSVSSISGAAASSSDTPTLTRQDSNIIASLDEYLQVKNDLLDSSGDYGISSNSSGGGIEASDLLGFKETYSQLCLQMRQNFATAFKQQPQLIRQKQQDTKQSSPQAETQGEEGEVIVALDDYGEFLKYMSACDRQDELDSAEYWNELEQLIRENSQFATQP